MMNEVLGNDKSSLLSTDRNRVSSGPFSQVPLAMPRLGSTLIVRRLAFK